MNTVQSNQVEACYQELLAIVNSSMDERDKANQINTRVLEGSLRNFYIYAVLSHLNVFYNYLARFGQDNTWIRNICQTGPQAVELFFKNKGAVQFILTHSSGAKLISDIAKTSPRASELFFKHQGFIRLVVSHEYGFLFVRDIAKSSPRASELFFKDQALMQYVFSCASSIRLIRDIAQSSPQASELFFKQGLMQYVFSHADGSLLILEIIKFSPPQASEVFFQREDLTQLVLSHERSFTCIAFIAGSSPQTGKLFFQHQGLIQSFFFHEAGVYLMRYIARSSPEAANLFLYQDQYVEKVNMHPMHSKSLSWIEPIVKKALGQRIQPYFEKQMMLQFIEGKEASDIFFLNILSNSRLKMLSDLNARVQPIIQKVCDLKEKVNAESEKFGFTAINHVLLCSAPERKQHMEAMREIYHSKEQYLNLGEKSKNKDCKLLQLPVEIMDIIFKFMINIDYPVKRHHVQATDPQQEAPTHSLRR